MSDSPKARPVGINHVAIEVGDVEEALAFYGSIFEFELRGRSDSMAFVDLGDQFVAMAAADVELGATETHRHFGLVVDDADVVERRLDELDVDGLHADPPDFRDPWGNWVQVVAYGDVQFTKADHVRRGMGSPTSASPTTPSPNSPRRGWRPSEGLDGESGIGAASSAQNATTNVKATSTDPVSSTWTTAEPRTPTTA